MTHNPRIFWNAAAADPAARDEVYGIFGELRKRLAESRPDRLIVLSNDHLDNFFLDNIPPFCVGLSPTASGPFWYESEIMNIPSYTANIDVELGENLLEVGSSAHIDFAQAREFGLDHAFTIPLALLRPEQDLPIVPVFSNVFAYPLPTERRYFEVGQAIKRLIAERPKGERIAFISTFNLSVDVGGPKMGKRNDAFDNEALDLIKRGRAEEILTKLPVERMISVGNSTAEFLNYDATLGVVEDAVPDFAEYRQVPQWGGCPGIFWDFR